MSGGANPNLHVCAKEKSGFVVFLAIRSFPTQHVGTLAFQHLEAQAKAIVDMPSFRLLRHQDLGVQWKSGCHQDHLQKMERWKVHRLWPLLCSWSIASWTIEDCFCSWSQGQDRHGINTGPLSNTLSRASRSCTRWPLWNYFCAASVWRTQKLLGKVSSSHVARYNHVNTPLNIPPCSAIKFWDSSSATSLKCLNVKFCCCCSCC